MLRRLAANSTNRLNPLHEGVILTSVASDKSIIGKGPEGTGLRDERGAMLTPSLVARLRAEVTRVVVTAVEAHFPHAPASASQRAAEAVEIFFDLYDRRPVRDNAGGSRFNDSLWIFVVARVFQPRLIVESGVLRGHSMWLLRQACPDAEIHGFDVDLNPLVYRDPAAVLHEADWSDVPFPLVDGRHALAFFDDHVDHARRIREAHGRGFRTLLLDDNFPVFNLYATGVPPVPSLAMVMDPALPLDEEIRWLRNGKVRSARIDGAAVRQARSLVERHYLLPDLAPVTRYNPGSGLTVVKLAD